MVSDPRRHGGFSGDWSRVARDAYFTERACVVALYRTLQQLGFRGVLPLPHRIWEPFAGGNSIAAELEALGHEVAAGDVVDYRGCYGYRAMQRAPELRDYFADPSFEPFRVAYAIVTNPAYDDKAQGGRTAEMFLRAALAKPNCAVVWALLPYEWDLSSTQRPDLFDRPDYAMKVALRFRPAWFTPAGPIVSERTGAVEGPRDSFAWYGWFVSVRQRWAGARVVYADRPVLEEERAAAERTRRLARRFSKSTPPANAWWNKEDGE